KFRFYIGFTHSNNSPPTDITFFGATECDALPFGQGNDEFGCPTNGPGWKQLGKVQVAGSNQWKLADINVTPTEDIYAIAIGPDCVQRQSNVSIYYFFDNLVLDEAIAFDFQITASDQFCAPDVALSVPRLDSLTYQWYKEGVALEGELRPQLSRLYGDGTYQVRFQGPSGICQSTAPFEFIRPLSTGNVDTTICEDEGFWFADTWQDQPGLYQDTLKTRDNCDSVVTLNLEVFVNRPTRTRVQLWPGEQYLVGPARLSEPGWHEVQMFSSSGCDSTVIIELKFLRFFAPTAFTPNDDGVNDRYFIEGGTDVQALLDLQIFNRWGQQIYQGGGQEPGNGWDGMVKGRPAPEGVYMYKAQVLFVDGNVRERSGSLTLLR
ncbi:MAG: gliding motility-associated C-terminal domain-containing protein, partial [Bacteroidota bacterium]